VYWRFLFSSLTAAIGLYPLKGKRREHRFLMRVWGADWIHYFSRYDKYTAVNYKMLSYFWLETSVISTISSKLHSSLSSANRR
jgi:hypothetical protein